MNREKAFRNQRMQDFSQLLKFLVRVGAVAFFSFFLYQNLSKPIRGFLHSGHNSVQAYQ